MEDSGLAGETTIPKERSAKYTIGIWGEGGERTKATSFLEREGKRAWREEARD